MQVRQLSLFFIFFILFAIFIHLAYQYIRVYIYTDVTRGYTFDKDSKYFGSHLKFFNLIPYDDLHCHSNISLVILVLCQVNDKELRNTIRHTWGQWVTSKYSLNVPFNIGKMQYHSEKLKLFFVLGSKATDKDGIQREHKTLVDEGHYNDLMYFPGIKDSYMNLTLKTLTSLNFALNRCPNANFFLKADTDVFLNIPLLVDFCKRYDDVSQKHPLIFGNQQVRAPVIRDKNSKWYVPKSKYSDEFFPNYVTGCGYLLNRLAIEQVVKSASKVNDLFAWEDVAVTGIYSKNVSIVDTKLFRYENYMSNIDSCFMKVIILSHRISQKKMARLWNEIISNGTFCASSSVRVFDILMKELI